jgi:hypothetical protein
MLGLVGTLALQATANAQFAADRPTAPPVNPAVQPAPAPQPPSPPPPPPPPAPGFIAPQAPQPVVQNHPLAIKPEHGNFVICVKSYTGPKARTDAEELANYIRQKHNAAAWLFEYGAEQRQKEEAELAAARQRELAENAPFLAEHNRLQAELQKQAAAAGVEFIPAGFKIKVPKREVPEQWAVLVGGWADEATARRALDVIRQWPIPDKKHLLDMTFIAQQVEQGDKLRGVNKEEAYINPFAAAMLFNNPAVRRAPGAAQPVDPALAKLNSEEPLSLLKTRHPYTLLVKAYTVPMDARPKDQEEGILGKLFSGSDAAAYLEVTAKQARALAESLRHPSMQKPAQDAARRIGYAVKPIESYILHTRTGSLVCVGDYPAVDDPDLVAMGRLLQEMKFEVWDKPQDQGGRLLKVERMFGNVTPLKIPRGQ